MQNARQHDFLRIEFNGCCESLDLLDNDVELENVVSWILMINRLDALSVDGQAAIECDAGDASLKLEVACGESAADEKNARNAVADLLGLFDPAEHRVVRALHGDGEDAAPINLWPGREVARRSQTAASGSRH